MTNKTKPESCKTELCQYDSATRTRFYNGMLLTEEHLRAEQEYHRDARKRLNRHLFGSGIVCGLGIEEVGLCIKILPGVAIDCCGNLIEVCRCVTIDLSKECEKCYGSDCIPANKDPKEDYKIERFLVLRYREKETDPEPVMSPDDECKPPGEKPDCSASKVREGFCIELWEKCPCAEPKPGFASTLAETLFEIDEQAKRKLFGAQQGSQQSTIIQQPAGPLNLPDPCSPCGCCENAVGLAKLTIRCDTKKVEVNYDECRPEIIGPRLLKWIISKSQDPKYESKEREYLSSRLDHGSKANLIRAVLASEERGEQIAKLQKSIQEEWREALQEAVYPLREQQDKQNKELNELVRPIQELPEAVSQIKALQEAVHPLREQQVKQNKELTEARNQIKEFEKVLKGLTNRVTKVEARKPTP